METDPIEAAKIAAELDRLNRERQAIEQETLAQAEAEAMAALGIEEKGAVVITAAEGWHPGVVGLVAARLKEKFGRPAFAIALEPGGIGTGSGRSIAGVDIGRAVRRAVAEGLLVKGGGHAMAAGVTLRKGALAQLRAFLEAALSADVTTARRLSGLMIDGAVSAAGANLDLVAMIERAGPFGSGNPEPVIALPAHSVTYAEEVGQAHMRVRLKSADGAAVNAIAFRAAGQKLGTALLNSRGRQVHAAGSFAIDRYQGEERVQFRLTDIAAGGAFCGAVGSVLSACRQGVTCNVLTDPPRRVNARRRNDAHAGCRRRRHGDARGSRRRDRQIHRRQSDRERQDRDRSSRDRRERQHRAARDQGRQPDDGGRLRQRDPRRRRCQSQSRHRQISSDADVGARRGWQPASGSAATGTVTVLAKTSTGKLYAERKVVKVTVGGCGG